jgi:DNA-binding PadR family transcriptional regulator
VISLATFQGAFMNIIAEDRTLGVPRGLLRFLVLKMLSEKPMAGFEIVDQIEAQTNGRWKPSPGSIYPLMAWMLKKGLTEELPKDATGSRRYGFTSAGRRFFEEEIGRHQDFMRKLEFLTPILVGGLHLGPECENRLKIREAVQSLLQIFLNLTNNLERLSAKDTSEIAQALRDCSERLGNISQDSNVKNI